MNETLVSIGIVVLLVAAVGGEECHNKDFNEEHKHIEYRKNGTICRYSNGAYHCKDGNCHNTLYIKNYTKNEGNLHYTHYTFNYTGCSTRPKPPYHIIIQYQSSQKEVYDQLSNVTCELKRHKDGNDGISHYNTYNYNCSLGNCEFDWVKKTQQNAGKCSVKYHYENYKCNCNSSPYIESVRSSLYNGKYCHNEDFNEEHKHIEYQKNRTICSYSNGAYPCKDGNCHNALYTKSYTEKEGNLHYTHYTFNYIGISTNRKLLFHITIQYENSQKEVYDQLNNATCELKRDKDRNGTSHNNTYNYNCRLGNCVFDWVKKTQETETGLEKNCFVKYHYENYKCVGNPSLYNKSITDALKILHTNLTNIRPNQQEISYFVKGCSVVLSKAKNENEGGDEVIKVLEKLGDIVSKKLGIPINGTIGYEVSTSSIAFGVWNVQKLNFNGHTFPTISNNSTSQQHGITNQTITLPKNIFNFVHDINESYTSITSISYQPLKGMIANAAKSNASIGSTNIISTSIKPKLSKKLKKKNGVRISFNIPTNESLQPRCVFWKYDEYGNGTWSDDGCYIVENNPEHVQCECNHLTDFTILMTVKDVS